MKPCLVSSEMALNGTSFEFSLRLAQNGTSLEFSLWLALNGTYFDFLYYLFLFGKGGGQPFPDFVWNSLAGQLGQVVLYILPTQSQHFSKSRKSFFFSFQIVFFYHLSRCFFIFPDLFIIFRFLFIIVPVIFLILFPFFFIIFPVVFLKLIHQENGLNALCFMSTNNMFQLSHFKNN